MPRGRLIFPFVVELAQLDTAATAGSPAPGIASGYDPVFREPIRIPASGSQAGSKVRVETMIQFRAQIEPDQQERLEEMVSGDSPNSRMGIVAHFRDLESANLVGSDGRPLIRKRDRLTRILTTSGALVEEIPDPPGLYVVEVQSRGFGPGGRRNLLLITFENRDSSARSTSG